ncbi:MAG: UbiA prenyltransferase [candidate division WWE3 bacterium GW2011_GWF2_41_45]|nr:MAG: UbiA prenyltransferase [candidate division WWE3 bacterium GW2011_GWC2_41_23]KKS10688.1 MAG: UbiA prenyltransferase [candidate division WWE3 bacterium GW2011_GWF2_41_45]KKS12301.1 MAG: UbiA prenyltransferase [candidate division WWE3 bacterium GW2011_GWF1_41_53]KKS20375.1 MAG: UbiA prenyltransferase [candidate division WWE3 bacterium GW2011_GWE1_41_72]KKS61345.1 MAG: UbiA prenyltransferase [candidate division WWE3 bacterium GW2011_GWA1_42_46]KKS72993.1 MAG: UbiA prenyltransferase [candid
MFLHASVGAVLGYVFFYFQPAYGAVPSVILGAIGAMIPDADHLFYIFTYGRKTDYAKNLRHFLRNKELRGFQRFVMENHKFNTGIYSHNLVTVLIAVIFFLYFALAQENYGAAIFTLGMISHYSYDIFEDWLLLGRINPNWFLLFKREKINTPFFLKKLFVFAKLIRFFPNVLSSFPLIYGYFLANDFNLSLKELGFIFLATFLFSPVFYGAVYIMDDIRDLELDRKHPVKSHGRAIASGEISLATARRIFKILLFFSFVFALLLSHVLFVALGAFLILNLLYLFFLRKIPVADIVMSTVLHSMKLITGLFLASVSPLSFLAIIITDILAYLSIAAGKKVREHKEGYAQSMLDTNYADYLSIFQYIVYALSIAYLFRTSSEPGLFYRVVVTIVALSLTVLYKPKTAMRSLVDFLSYGDDREGTFTRVFNIKLWKRSTRQVRPKSQ